MLTRWNSRQRLAALVPRPRSHLIRFHGVLAPECEAAITGRAGADATRTERRARVLKRVFDIDIERCACGGKLKMIADIEEPAVIEKILTHLGLSAPPPRAKARRLDVLEWAS